MRTRPIKQNEYKQLLRQLQPPYDLLCMIARDTGLRVSDILAIETGNLAQTLWVTERKTGKRRRVTLSRSTLAAARKWARHGGYYLIGRDRSTVYRQIKQAARKLGYDRVSAHSLRKLYAREYARAHGLAATQRELQHNFLSTTLLYLMDEEELTNGLDCE